MGGLEVPPWGCSGWKRVKPTCVFNLPLSDGPVLPLYRRWIRVCSRTPLASCKPTHLWSCRFLEALRVSCTTSHLARCPRKYVHMINDCFHEALHTVSCKSNARDCGSTSGGYPEVLVNLPLHPTVTLHVISISVHMLLY